MRIAHFGDLHFCQNYLTEVDRCTAFAVDQVIKHSCDLVVIPGDLFDRSCTIHDKSVERLFYHIKKLVSVCPVVILQGTYSHDVPGSLKPFRYMQDVHVFEGIGQTYVPTNAGKVLISHLPPVNKAQLAAKFGADKAALAAGEHVHNLMIGWAEEIDNAHVHGDPAIIISHGTVAMSETEHGVPMAGNDHEFTPETLFASHADAIMLNHIHKFQSWSTQDNRRHIAYAGSIGRLHFGEKDDKGFLIWDVDVRESSFQFIKTPAKVLIHIEYEDMPDMDDLRRQAVDAKDAHVRLRYKVDSDKRDQIDLVEIKALFEHAEHLKIEPTVNHIVRTRAAGITKATDISQKLSHWANVTEIDEQPMQDRLQILQSCSVDEIVNNIVGAAA